MDPFVDDLRFLGASEVDSDLFRFLPPFFCLRSSSILSNSPLATREHQSDSARRLDCN